MANYKNLYWTTRMPGEEIDRIDYYGNDKPRHVVVYR